MRRGLMESVERLRKAARDEVPMVLELLRRQASDLAQVLRSLFAAALINLALLGNPSMCSASQRLSAG